MDKWAQMVFGGIKNVNRKNGDKKMTKKYKSNMIKSLHLWKKEKSMEFGISENCYV